MSRIIELAKLSNEEREKITKELVIQYEKSKYAFGNDSTKQIVLYDLVNKNVVLPFAYNTKYPRPTRDSFSGFTASFEADLREEQKEVATEAIKHLNTTGSTIIAAYCGFGKTALAIYLATVIRLKVLVVCNRIVIINQWRDSIKKFSPSSKIEILSPKKDPSEDADFYIINAINIPKFSSTFYKNIGFLIVDEAHQILADKLSQGMKHLTPRYSIGLSATPYRNDGLDILFSMYFGKNKIERKLFRNHTVYIVPTKFAPEAKQNRMGKLDWNSIIEPQATNVERNELIISILKKFSDRTFLVICKRLSQADYLIERLKEEKESVTDLIRKNQTYDKNCRILVGISGKVSTGFDDQRLDALLLAADIKDYFTQYLGRVFRKKEVEPIIFDFDDNFGVLKSHLRTRKIIYKEHGGTIKKLELS